MSFERDDFPEGTKRTLMERAGNRCSNPFCRCLTSGPNAEPHKATKIGVAAHITAASPGGPRYDPALSTDERKAISNGIWLCQNCAKLIDADPITYTVELIKEWKIEAEKCARQALEGEPPKPQTEGYSCPHCGTLVAYGNSVCLGCNAEIFHGSTTKEREDDFRFGLGIGLCMSLVSFFLLPETVSNLLHLSIAPAWGMSIIPIIIIGTSITIGMGFAVLILSDKQRRAKGPRFFRISIV